MNRIQSMLLALSVAVSACGFETRDNPVFAPYLRGFQNLGGPAPVTPTADDIRAQVTPQVRAEYGGAPLLVATLDQKNLASILIERARNRDLVTYFTPDDISVTLKHGVLVGTRGLGFDLMTADVDEVRPGLQGKVQQAVRIHRYLDGEDQIVIRSFVCDYQGQQQRRETCFGDGFEIENTYQLDGSGEILSSRQWISPEQGYITLEPAS